MNKRNSLTLDDYEAGVLAGDRAVLGRAITLVESRNAEHQAEAQTLLQRLLPKSGAAQRVGISGVPGVGKSTFVDALGTNLTAAGHKVAVLAVDPSSERSGGSILGDKTRMPRLAVDESAFIRPSPAAGVLGGVARATRESMVLVEAAGYDVVLVETVGTGQSETQVADMVDFFLVLMLPGAGDELQGIKKGILELADMIAINKADVDQTRTRQALREYKSALHIMTPADPDWPPPAVACSGLKNDGLDALWDKIEQHRRITTDSGARERKRRAQRVTWMWAMVEDQLLAALRGEEAVQQVLARVEADVIDGRLTASAGAGELLKAFGVD